METAIKIAELPWTTLLTLASGYAGYFVAHLGARDHHKAADITFGTIVFGFWGLLSYQVAVHRMGFGSLSASWLAMSCSIFIGCVWSVMGRPGLQWLLRKLSVSHADDLPSGWLALGKEPGFDATQVGVKTTDGAYYLCENLARFEGFPNGPCTLGGNGDVLMYVTHYRGPESEEFVATTAMASPDWGAEITFIPRDRIALVDLRRKPRVPNSLLGWPRRGA